MKPQRTLLITTILVHLFFDQTPAFAARVGIFGCAHGSTSFLEKILEKMKAEKITHLIGNGDFLNIYTPGPSKYEQLETMLSYMEKKGGIPKGNTYLMPGNWEDADARSPEQLKATRELFEKYGNLISTKYDGA